MPHSPPPLKAVVFDLDGTLVDSLADLATAVNRMLAANGYPLAPIEMFPLYIGDGMKKLVERAMPEAERTAENVERCAAEYLAQYERCWHAETHVYEGLAEVIADLQARGLRLAVLSNKPDRFTKLCAEHFFSAGTFEIVLGAREDVPRKPDPAAGLEIAALMGLRPDECAYVGDSGIDMEFGRRAGMRRVGVLWGFRDRDEIIEHGAQIVVERPSDLSAALLAQA